MYTDGCIEDRYDGTIDGLTVGINDDLMDGHVVGKKILGGSEETKVGVPDGLDDVTVDGMIDGSFIGSIDGLADGIKEGL